MKETAASTHEEDLHTRLLAAAETALAEGYNVVICAPEPPEARGSVALYPTAEDGEILIRIRLAR